MVSGSSWSYRKKRRGRIWLFVSTLVVGALVGIIVRNNPEILSSTVQQASSPTGQDKTPAVHESWQPDSSRALPRSESVGESGVAAEGLPPAAAHTAPAPAEPVVEKPVVRAEPADSEPAPQLRRSVLLPGILCRTLDRRDLKVFVTVEVFFYGDSLADEIMVKRDGLKVLVQNVLAHTPFASVQSEPLRRRIQTELSGMLDKGALSEVEFREFRIAPAGS